VLQAVATRSAIACPASVVDALPSRSQTYLADPDAHSAEARALQTTHRGLSMDSMDNARATPDERRLRGDPVTVASVSNGSGVPVRPGAQPVVHRSPAGTHRRVPGLEREAAVREIGRRMTGDGDRRHPDPQLRVTQFSLVPAPTRSP